MKAIIVYDDNKDRELLNLIDSRFPIFVEYINYNSLKGRKEAYKVKSHWGARKNPFVVVKDDNDSILKIFYSETDNAIHQLINWLSSMKVLVVNKGNKKLPKFETSGAAGADIRADFSRIQEYPIKVHGGAEVITAGEAHDKIMVKLTPHSRALIPTGLYVAIPEGYELQIRPRSGLALKEGLTVINTPGTVDSDYRGEVGVVILNTSNEDRFIEDGERIAQILLKKVIQFDWEEVDTLSQTDRGEGGFNSTGKL